jgi:hypothetical protein
MSLTVTINGTNLTPGTLQTILQTMVPDIDAAMRSRSDADFTRDVTQYTITDGGSRPMKT